MTDTLIGAHNLSVDLYGQDPCPEPSLNAGTAKVLLDYSPRHAWLQSRRLNPAWEPSDNKDFDLGKAAHAVLLQGGAGVAVLDFDSYRTKESKEARDAALTAGKLPILAEKWDRVEAMVRAARAQLDAHEIGFPFVDGLPEQTLIWREGETWCRARLDWLPNKGNDFYDYKTTGASANPEGIARLIFGMHDLQMAFYLRGIRAVLARPAATFRLVVQETEPPYALSVVGLTPAALALADRKMDEALGIWRQCLTTGKWPGYPARTCWIDAPSYHETAITERQRRGEIYGMNDKEMFAAMMDWQAPK